MIGLAEVVAASKKRTWSRSTWSISARAAASRCCASARFRVAVRQSVDRLIARLGRRVHLGGDARLLVAFDLDEVEEPVVRAVHEREVARQTPSDVLRRHESTRARR